MKSFSAGRTKFSFKNFDEVSRNVNDNVKKWQMKHNVDKCKVIHMEKPIKGTELTILPRGRFWFCDSQF